MITDDCPIDPTVLRRLARQGGAELLREVVAVFLEQSAAGVARALAAAEDDSLDEVRLAAHSLVSAAASVGARRLQRVAERTESLALDQDWERIRAVLPELVVAARDAAREIEGARYRAA